MSWKFYISMSQMALKVEERFFVPDLSLTLGKYVVIRSDMYSGPSAFKALIVNSSIFFTGFVSALEASLNPSRHQ